LVHENELVIEIFFQRKNSHIKILIEKWSLIVFDKGKVKDLKRYITLIRTVYTYSRILPAYNLFKNKGFNYIIDYSFYFNDSLCAKNEYFLKKRHSLNIELLNVKLSIEYITKSEIFKIEEDMVVDFIYLSLSKRIRKYYMTLQADASAFTPRNSVRKKIHFVKYRTMARERPITVIGLYVRASKAMMKEIIPSMITQPPQSLALIGLTARTITTT
jgi:hypothetical protein